MSSITRSKVENLVAVFTAAVLLSACQSNGITPQQSTGGQPAAAPLSEAAAPNSKVEQYSVTLLPTLGGDLALGNTINNTGVITGASILADDVTVHATLWNQDNVTDLGTLGGPLSEGFYVNAHGVVVGTSETSSLDPNSEQFCASDQYVCSAFYWSGGTMHALPTLGGNNSQGFGVNSAGTMIGYAETATKDPICALPQVFDYRATSWNRLTGQASALPSLPGDSTSVAYAIDSAGDITGSSGSCEHNDVHAVLWPPHGAPNTLSTLGGAYGNGGLAINNSGDVAGGSDFPGDAVTHAVLWKKGYSKAIDLGTIDGFPFSAAFSVNDKDQVVGIVFDASGNQEGFLWENGTMHSLNSLIPASANLYVSEAISINDASLITGLVCQGPDFTYCPAFRATPNGRIALPRAQRKIVLPQQVRNKLMRGLMRSHFRPIHR